MIPYTIEARPETGVTNVTLGIWLFLASEVMLFGAFFSAYALLRFSAPEWPDALSLLDFNYAAVNTLVLVVMTIVSWQARRAPIAAARRLLLVAAALALAFLAIKAVEYGGEIRRGLVPSINTFLATYFTLTGLHALHVAGGLVANLWTLAGAGKVPQPLTRGRLHALALYWGFVDIVWLLILVFVYVV
jgi:heme/copper-type cytochrome/quinol oxidase subunit 3